jgi:hypothetical protein
MLWRVRSSRGRPKNPPTGFIQRCRPTGRRAAAARPRLGALAQARRLPAADPCPRRARVTLASSKRRPGSKGAAILDAEVVCLSPEGVADFDRLHSRVADDCAIALGFDLLRDGDDLHRRSLVERKAALAKLLFRSRGGIQYVEHAEGHGEKMFAAVCNLGLEGIVSKKIDAPYRSRPSKSWMKVKKSKITGGDAGPLTDVLIWAGGCHRVG